MYKYLLAFRYLIKRRISYFCVFAVTLCVFVVLIVMTVLSGLTGNFLNKLHRYTGDCVVASKSLVGFTDYQEFADILMTKPFVTQVSPAVRTYGLLRNGRYVRTVEVVGFDPVLQSQVTNLEQIRYYNKNVPLSSFFDVPDTNLPGFAAGIALLFDRDQDGTYMANEDLPFVEPSIECFPLNHKGALARAATSVMSSRTFRLVDVFKAGLKTDWNNVYISFGQAQLLSGMNTEPKRASSLFIKFTDNANQPQAIEKVKLLWNDFLETKKDSPYYNLLENVKVQSWKDFNRNSVAIAQTQEAMMILLFAMMGIITVFIIFVVFYMIVNHKSKDIGILKSIGVSNSNLAGIFLLFAFYIGVIGSLIGSLSGWLFLTYINPLEDWLHVRYGFQFFNREVYAIGDLPNDIKANVLCGIIIAAIAACLVGAYMPARRAAKLKPVETLQVNRI